MDAVHRIARLPTARRTVFAVPGSVPPPPARGRTVGGRVATGAQRAVGGWARGEGAGQASSLALHRIHTPPARPSFAHDSLAPLSQGARRAVHLSPPARAGAPRWCPTSGDCAIPPGSSASHQPRATPPDRQVTSPPFAGWPPGISLSSRPTGQQRRRNLSTATRTDMAAQPSEDELAASPRHSPPSPTTSPLTSRHDCKGGMLVAYEPIALEMALLPAEATRTRQLLAVGDLAVPIGKLVDGWCDARRREEADIRSLESHALTIPLEGGGACRPVTSQRRAARCSTTRARRRRGGRTERGGGANAHECAALTTRRAHGGVDDRSERGTTSASSERCWRSQCWCPRCCRRRRIRRTSSSRSSHRWFVMPAQGGVANLSGALTANRQVFSGEHAHNPLTCSPSRAAGARRAECEPVHRRAAQCCLIVRRLAGTRSCASCSTPRRVSRLGIPYAHAGAAAIVRVGRPSLEIGLVHRASPSLRKAACGTPVEREKNIPWLGSGLLSYCVCVPSRNSYPRQ